MATASLRKLPKASRFRVDTVYDCQPSASSENMFPHLSHIRTLLTMAPYNIDTLDLFSTHPIHRCDL